MCCETVGEMDLIELLEKCDQSILHDASSSVVKYRLKHYEGSSEQVSSKLALLFDYVAKCVRARNVIPMVSYVEKLAELRYESGFDLQEVQTAFNVLEEVFWKYILEYIDPGSQIESLSLISSIIGSGKDTLARTYVQLSGAARN